MSRLELLKRLTMVDVPEVYLVEKMTIQELRSEAKKRGHTKGVWRLLRAELIELLFPSSKKDNEDDDGGKKHNNP